MNGLLYLLLAVLCLAVCQAMTTTLPEMTTTASFGEMTTTSTGHHHHNHHTTKESDESQKILFYYESDTHQLSLSYGHRCYISTLTADELNVVHTNAGMRSIELRMLSTLTQATEVTKDTLNAKDIKHCAGHTSHYYTVNV